MKKESATLFLRAFTKEILLNIRKINVSNGKISQEDKSKFIDNAHKEFRKVIKKRYDKINFGKIEPLINDQKIRLIECPGPNKFILVKTQEKTEAISISLTEMEIQEIIKEFSKFTKTPILEGVFHAKAGNLEINAVISKIAGSRFMVSKNL